MELKLLYPRWINSVSSDQICTINNQFYWPTLKLSLLHQTYLTDFFGVDKLRHGIELNWVGWSYEFEKISYYRRLSFDYHQLSLSWIYPSLTWFEREVWEMFGVMFSFHPDLRRLTTDYGFRSYPLLKAYPTTGYFQVFYSEKNKRITASPTNLAQEFRLFNFQSPWQK